ncbi:UTP:RNA uridylyltransferase 1, partial [Ananas comosus]
MSGSGDVTGGDDNPPFSGLLLKLLSKPYHSQPSSSSAAAPPPPENPAATSAASSSFLVPPHKLMAPPQPAEAAEAADRRVVFLPRTAFPDALPLSWRFQPGALLPPSPPPPPLPTPPIPNPGLRQREAAPVSGVRGERSWSGGWGGNGNGIGIRNRPGGSGGGEGDLCSFGGSRREERRMPRRQCAPIERYHDRSAKRWGADDRARRRHEWAPTAAIAARENKPKVRKEWVPLKGKRVGNCELECNGDEFDCECNNNGSGSEGDREESVDSLPSDAAGERKGAHQEDDALEEEMIDSLELNDDLDCRKMEISSKTWSRKELRSDALRGHKISSLQTRARKSQRERPCDIETFTPSFFSLYETLIPAEEDKANQEHLLSLLAKSLNKEWPEAQLHLYGSWANTFGFSNSDIDMCIAIDDSTASNHNMLLKVADIMELNNFQNVQAITNARVPIVRMTDPVTGISCDICINNLLAVANTKLLKDYAQIDDRLHQLVLIVKHWAKSRAINEAYRGTLSSYTYVIMCIHFLQQRKPAILPCLQEMEATYTLTIDGVECNYFDQVQELSNFGAKNKENIAQLLWAFFHYWAYKHDYKNDVISVRTGSIISKQEKHWTTRVGNDRHLICIEDPFETSRDLGRVVDKHTVKILREEFERAADILQYDPKPSVTLFEPYVTED